MLTLRAVAVRLSVSPSTVLIEIPVPPVCGPGLYFLCYEGAIVYVGQSLNVYKRIEDHRLDKQFTQVFFMPCARADLSRLESEFIHKLRPVLNGTFPNGSKCAPRKKPPIVVTQKMMEDAMRLIDKPLDDLPCS